MGLVVKKYYNKCGLVTSSFVSYSDGADFMWSKKIVFLTI